MDGDPMRRDDKNEIKVFNQHLNASYNADFMHGEWTAYRDVLTDFSVASLREQSNILVVGAGNLNDLDLKKMQGHTGTLHLTDIDVESVKQGIQRQGFEPDGFQITELDLTGLAHDDLLAVFWESFDEALVQGNREGLEVFFEKREINYPLAMYDGILILPIYSQLLFFQLLTRVEKSQVALDQELAEWLMRLVASWLSKVNEALLQHLNDHGKLILFADVLEYHRQSDDYRMVQDMVKMGIDLRDYYDQFLETFGYTLGAYGILDMVQRIEVQKEAFFIWDFDETRSMLVKGIDGTLMKK